MSEYIYKLEDPSTGDTMYPVTTDQAVLCDDGGTLGDKVDSHKTDKTNPHGVTKEQVGLGSVVNTGDSGTPVAGGTTKFTTGGAYAELNKKEDKENKSEIINSSSLATQYPTSKAVYDELVKKADLTELYNIVNTIDDDTGTKYQGIYNLDWTELPKICGQPIILFGEGIPQKDIVPSNWIQLNSLTGEGYNWDGTPSALGQQYINISAESNGRYIAVPNGTGLKWLNF